MPASKEITNMVKEMEQNLKHLKTSIDEAMEKVYHKLDRQEKTMDEIIKSQKFLSPEFENLKITVEEIKQQDFLNKIRGLFKKYPTFLYKAHNTINFASFIQSPSKYSPWWFTHLSQRFCHFSKHFINSSPGML